MHRSSPSESEVLISLLADSANLKVLRRLALTIPPCVHSVGIEGGPMQRVGYYPLKEALARIEASRTFTELLSATQNPTTYSAPLRAFVFFASYVHDHSSFAYYTNQLRQEVIDAMTEHGFSDTKAPAHQF